MSFVPFTEAHPDPTCNHEEELTMLKDTLAQQQQIVKLTMELGAKDSQLQDLRELLHAKYTFNPKALHESTVPDYFKYNTGFTYHQFNDLCTFFKVPNNPSAPHTPIPLEYTRPDQNLLLMPLRNQFLFILMKLRQNFNHKDLAHKFQIPVQCQHII